MFASVVVARELARNVSLPLAGQKADTIQKERQDLACRKAEQCGGTVEPYWCEEKRERP